MASRVARPFEHPRTRAIRTPEGGVLGHVGASVAIFGMEKGSSKVSLVLRCIGW